MYHYILEPDKNPIPATPLGAEKFSSEDFANRRVAIDEKDGIQISTVFLMHDPNPTGGKPLLFETMVFGGHGSEDWQERYTSEAEARVGHQRAVEWVNDTLLPLHVGGDDF